MANDRRVTVLDAPNGGEPLAYLDRIGDVAYSSTVTGRDPVSGRLADGPEAQFDVAFASARKLAESAGLTIDDLAHLTVVINDASYRQYINKPWLDMFPNDDDRPARKTNHARLPEGELVNLHFVAVPGGRRQPLGIPGLAHRDPLPMGVRSGKMVLSSVLGGDDPATGKRVEDPDAQIDQVFRNMRALVEHAGGTVDDIAHVLVFMDMEHQPSMVRAWLEMFPEDGNRPARKTISYSLGTGSVIQMQFTAAIGGRRENFEVEGIGHHDPIPLANKQAGLLYSSGITGVSPSTGKLADGAERQTVQALQNVAKVMELAGSSTNNLIQVTALVADNEHRSALLTGWRELFPRPDDQPALHILELGLPGRDTVVQMNVVGAF